MKLFWYFKLHKYKDPKFQRSPLTLADPKVHDLNVDTIPHIFLHCKRSDHTFINEVCRELDYSHFFSIYRHKLQHSFSFIFVYFLCLQISPSNPISMNSSSIKKIKQLFLLFGLISTFSIRFWEKFQCSPILVVTIAHVQPSCFNFKIFGQNLC